VTLLEHLMDTAEKESFLLQGNRALPL